MSAPHADQVVVVTGGNGALGRWVVREFAAAGIRVHAPVRSPEETGEVDAFLGEELAGRAGIPVTWEACDVTDPEAVDAFMESVARAHGRLDALVNGVGGFTMAPLEETDPGTWEGMLSVNATSAFLCARAAAPLMREARRGAMINVASMPALARGGARMSAYSAAKSALLNLTYSLAEELRPDGITVNAVVPTVIDTPANRRAMPGADTSTWLHPREIARVVMYLASDEGRAVNGAAIRLAKE